MHRAALAPSTFTFAALLIAGCAAPHPDTREPLPAGRAVEVHYVSRLAPATARVPGQPGDPAELVAARAWGAARDRAVDSDAPAQAVAGPFVRVQCAQYQVDARSLSSLLEPGGPRAFGRVAARADVQRVLDARIADGSVQRSARPSLRVRDGGTASMSTTNQQAFVEGFEITRAGADLIGDPCIATTEEGIALDVRARLGAARSVTVDVAWKHTELLRPLLESSVRLPGSGVDVVVQIPLAVRQELASSVELGPDEVLVLGGLHGQGGAYDVLVVVDAHREEGGAGGSGGRAGP